jgi:hypothetical protein
MQRMGNGEIGVRRQFLTGCQALTPDPISPLIEYSHSNLNSIIRHICCYTRYPAGNFVDSQNVVFEK